MRGVTGWFDPNNGAFDPLEKSDGVLGRGVDELLPSLDCAIVDTRRTHDALSILSPVTTSASTVDNPVLS